MKSERIIHKSLLKDLKNTDLSHWIRSLEFFYFFTAWGGHANDGDRFEAHINYLNKSDLIFKLNQLNIEILIIPDDYPRPKTGKSYSPEEYEIFKSEIQEFPELEQPGHRVINGIPVFIWVDTNSIMFSVSGTADGNRYEVSKDDYEACIKLEQIFNDLNWDQFKNTDVESNICCITFEKYADLINISN